MTQATVSVCAGIPRSGTTMVFRALAGLPPGGTTPKDYSGAIIKTHTHKPETLKNVERAIFLFGDPVASVISTRKHRWHSSHFANCGSPNSDPSTSDIYRADFLNYSNMFFNWNRRQEFDLIVVRYEALHRNLDQICSFFGCDIDFPPYKPRSTSTKDDVNETDLAAIQRTYGKLIEAITAAPDLMIFRAPGRAERVTFEVSRQSLFQAQPSNNNVQPSFSKAPGGAGMSTKHNAPPNQSGCVLAMEETKETRFQSLFHDLPMYVIALPERRGAFEARMAQYGFDYEFIDAVDWREKATPDTWQYRGHDYGCTQSHLRALDHAYSRQNEYFFIVEDDFKFRDDAFSFLPSIEDVENADFDVLYLTGHYAKGATQVEARRIHTSERLVRSSGIHTLPCRLIHREYAPTLMDTVRHNVVHRGFGVDRTDAILQSTRKRTYASEHHLGGHLQNDKRCWEPRVIDHYVRAATAVIGDYQGRGDESPVTTAAKIAFASRRQRWLVFDGSLRTIAALCEGALHRDGAVVAVNNKKEHRQLTSNPSDRLARYQSYGTLDLAPKGEDVGSAFTGVYIEHAGHDTPAIECVIKSPEIIERGSWGLVMGDGRQHASFRDRVHRAITSDRRFVPFVYQFSEDLWWVLVAP